VHRGHGRGGRVVLVVLVVVFIVDVRIPGGEAAADQERDRDEEPFHAARVPRRNARNSGLRGLGSGKGRARSQAKFPVPGDQVQVILPAHLAPQREHRHQRDQE
jgi:hypothetical protein